VLPPRLAPIHVVILPIIHKPESAEMVRNYCQKLADDLKAIAYHGRSLQVEIDQRDMRGGEKTWSWIKKGVPIRVEIGPRDIETDSVFVARRDQDSKQKQSIPRGQFVEHVRRTLEEMQAELFRRACAFRDARTRVIDSKEDFDKFFQGEGAGFAMTHTSGDPAIEARIKNELGVTLRCFPLHDDAGPGTCPFTGRSSPQAAVWAKAY
jgi:prolyl-tRNA synthetase